MTQPTASEVEAAVRAILAQLRGRAPASSARVEPGVIDFPGPLLAARQVERMGEGARAVRIAPGTVVTPLAADALKRRGIAIRWGSTGELRPTGTWAFAVEPGAESGAVVVLRRHLLGSAGPWSELPASEAAAWVAGGEDRGAAVLAECAAPSVWRACQVPGVRAASARDTDEVDRAIRALGPNYLVVEPAGLPIPLLKNLVETFRKGGAPRIPDSLVDDGRDGESHHEDRRGGRSGHAFAGPREPEERPAARHPPDDLRRLGGGLVRSW